MVMERVYGIDLERHLARGCVIDVPEALGILAQTADALAAVHRAGMAHRDLKPGNVMLCAGARVVLLDLGIMLPEIDTATLVRCGTPRYLAPEVIRGVIARGDAHMVDVYALGAMAFELFAGRPVFDAESIVRMLEHHVMTPAPDLSALRPDLPNALVALVAACLQKDPRERPRDMEAVAGDLRNIARRLVTRPTTGSGPVVGVRERVRRDVLIIEDDEDIREGLSTILTARGFRVTVAANGREAQDLIARRGRRPNVILLDLMMPVMDGVEFLSQQSTLPSLDGVPVLLVTAQSPANALGFPSVRGVVSKPLAMATLLRRLADLCGEC
jgi:serine/threonine-protein kinase